MDLRCCQILTDWQGSGLRLPGEVLWALSLNEGTPISAVRDDDWRKVRFSKEGWGEWDVSVGTDGNLGLESLGQAGLFVLGEPLLLFAEVWHAEAYFTLESARGRAAREELSAQALYWLRVDSDFLVFLPPDALWALGIAEGEKLRCRVEMWTLKGGHSPEGLKDTAQLDLEVQAGGALGLPEALRKEPRLQPGSPVRFELNVAGPDSWFRLEPDLSRE